MQDPQKYPTKICDETELLEEAYNELRSLPQTENAFSAFGNVVADNLKETNCENQIYTQTNSGYYFSRPTWTTFVIYKDCRIIDTMNNYDVNGENANKCLHNIYCYIYRLHSNVIKFTWKCYEFIFIVDNSFCN